MAASTSRPPGRPGLTFERYEAAFRELSGPDGDPPSQRQIRRYLGTGSNSTLSGYRRRIAEQRSEQAVAPEHGTLDEKLLISVTQLVSQLSIEAAQVADDRVDEIEADAQRRIQIAETTMEKRLQDTALLEHRAKSAEAALAKTIAQKENLEKTLSTLATEHQELSVSQAEMQQSLANTQRQLAERTQMQQVLQSDLETLQKVRTEQSERLSQFEQTEIRLQETNAALTEKQTLLKDRVGDRDEVIAQLHQKQSGREAELKTSRELQMQMAAQLEDEKRDHASVVIVNRELKTELRSVQAHHQSSIERLVAELDAKGKLLDSLQDALMALASNGSDSVAPTT